jgi:hypothetical protein
VRRDRGPIRLDRHPTRFDTAQTKLRRPRIRLAPPSRRSDDGGTRLNGPRVQFYRVELRLEPSVLQPSCRKGVRLGRELSSSPHLADRVGSHASEGCLLGHLGGSRSREPVRSTARSARKRKRLSQLVVLNEIRFVHSQISPQRRRQRATPKDYGCRKTERIGVRDQILYACNSCSRQLANRTQL